MPFQSIPGEIHWKVHFASPIEKVYDALATGEGRKKYWAESAGEKDGVITFEILNYPPYPGRILRYEAPRFFSVDYFGTEVRFELEETADGGTDLSLQALVADEALRQEMIPGWVSVLMAMKAAVDFDVDIRNHNIDRCWENGYLDN